MILIACVDDNMGMAFNKRRQSQDRILRSRILERTKGTKLWMSDYSYKQFSEDFGNQIYVSDRLEDAPETGEYCFIENQKTDAFVRNAEKIILYRWNRKYPADLWFDIAFTENGWKLVESTDFSGSSHEKITEEVYIK